MTQRITKAEILRAVSELPKDATLDDAFERLFVLHKIERGLKEAQAGQTRCPMKEESTASGCGSSSLESRGIRRRETTRD